MDFNATENYLNNFVKNTLFQYKTNDVCNVY